MEIAAKFCFIKQITSGDTVILCGDPQGGPPWEKRLSFSSVRAPRLASHGNPNDEESYAWKAREYTRKRLIGNQVMFKDEYEVNGRAYGYVRLQNEGPFSHELLKAGLATVEYPHKNNAAADYDELKKCEAEAKKKKLNLWSGVESKRPSVTKVNREDAALTQFFNLNAYKRLPAIIEAVKDGSTFDVLFTDVMLQGTLHLSGVQCDSVARDDGDSYAAEATFFVEIRLLNRDVEVRLEHIDNRGLFGTVYHPKGNMSCFLLSAGFAKIHERTIKKTEAPERLYEALKEAQKKKLRKWKNYRVTDSRPSQNTSEVYLAAVLEVKSGDSMLLQLEDGTSRRVYLASLKAPKWMMRREPQLPWANEAFEFVRKSLIGRQVKVKVEFNKMFANTKNGGNAAVKGGIYDTGNDDGNDTFQHVQILYDNSNKNISEELIKHGLAKTVGGKPDDPVASNYDRLLELEQEAKLKLLGVHGPEKNAPIHKMNDLTEPSRSKGAKSFLMELQESSPLEGIVRYIIQPNRFKILLPTKKLIIWLALSNLRSPRSSRGAHKDGASSDDVGDMALAYANRTLMQRDVTVTVESCGNHGVFFGTVMHKKHVNFSLELLELGYAYLNDAVPDTSPYKASESVAKLSMRGFWSQQGGAMSAVKSTEAIQLNENVGPVVITHINSLSDFYIQELDPSDLAFITAELAAVDESVTSDKIAVHPLKVGTMVIGKFTADGLWYRGVIKQWQSSEREYEIHYIDFGNKEMLHESFIRQCPQCISTLPYQSRNCQLAGLLCPPGMEDEAAQQLYDLTEESSVHCLLEECKDDVYSVILSKSADSATTINEELASGGYAYLNKSSTTSIASSLKAAETVAKLAHLNIWQHGDVIEDVDEENL